MNALLNIVACFVLSCNVFIFTQIKYMKTKYVLNALAQQANRLLECRHSKRGSNPVGIIGVYTLYIRNKKDIYILYINIINLLKSSLQP